MDGNYRAHWHNYCCRCIYMVTVKKEVGVPPFGTLMGSHTVPAGQRGSSYIEASPTGQAIKDVLRTWTTFAPDSRLLQYAIMPDHLHLLIFVERQSPLTLGQTVSLFKVAVNKRCDRDRVFARGFNDQILKSTRSLQQLYRYLQQNPIRLAVRRAHPEYFCRVNTLTVNGLQYQAYGNFLLLQNPFRHAVVIHRSDSPAVRRTNRDCWLHAAANGGVLVSPFISAPEQQIRQEAIQLGGRIILLIHTPLPPRWKPSGTLFHHCATGRLLILSTAQPGPLTRQTCLHLNACAAAVAERLR